MTRDDRSTRLEDLADRIVNRLGALPRPVVILGSSLALGLAYMAIARASYAFVIPPNLNAVFWLPSGMTFALFVRARRARWLWPGWSIAIFIGEMMVVRAQGHPLSVALAWPLANVLVPTTGGLLACRFAPEPFGFRQLRDVIVLAAITAVAAAPGALVASAAGVHGLGVPSFARMAFSWWCSDALGILLFAPVVLSWTTRQPRPSGGGLEAVVLSVCLVGLGLLGLHQGDLDLTGTMPALVLPFVAWASIRFGPRGTTVAMLLVDAILVSAAARGTGLFAGTASPADRLLNVQLLVASVNLLVLLLAAAIEQQRVARTAAENAARIRDEFLSIASHELHTPLTSLQLSVQLLLEQGLKSADGGAKFLEVIQRQVQKLTALISDLLDTTRARENRLSLTLEQVDLPAVARDVAARATTLLDRSGSTLTIRADVPVCGRWDRTRVEQVITNLLSNAAKFGDAKPIEMTIDLETSDLARLVIEDHGIGIPPDRLPDVFGRFEQAVAQRQYGGLGLGLYIARSLVELHGGSITAASTPGSGSTFTVRLPLRGPAC
jgi:signal transduction histidine kinase